MAILEYQSIIQAQAYVQVNSAKLRAAVQSNLRFPQIRPAEAFWISRRILWIALAVAVFGLALFATGAGLLTQRDLPNGVFTGLAISGGLLFVLPAFLLIHRSWRLGMIKSRVQFDAPAAYKQFFADNFDNLVVTGPSARDQLVALARRPSPVPADARITKINPGFDGTIDGFQFHTYWAMWMWTRTINTGKTTVTKTYYYHVLGGGFVGLNDRFDNFEMYLRYPASDGVSKFFGLGKRATKLENTSFEKRTALTSNDEIALRRVLTPRTQELILERITGGINYTEVLVQAKTLNVLRQDSHESFQVNFRMSTNREKVVASYTQDLMADIAHFIAFISHIHDYATLSRG